MRRGFSLIELLVVIAIVALLVGIMLPSLAGARDAGRQVRCMSGVRQMAAGWALYAGDFDDYAMPLAYFEARDVGAGDSVFWFGSDGRVSGRVDYGRGFLTPYLDAAHGERSVYECPSQAWGTYAPQTRTGQATTTYGYNGYYLSPPKTPGWGGASGAIGDRPWRRAFNIDRPAEVLGFADTLLPVGRAGRSTALLDPPMLFDGRGGWRVNASPTTAFRHAGRASASRLDGSATARTPSADAVFDRRLGVGSVSAGNGPAYVPDWARW